MTSSLQEAFLALLTSTETTNLNAGLTDMLMLPLCMDPDEMDRLFLRRNTPSEVSPAIAPPAALAQPTMPEPALPKLASYDPAKLSQEDRKMKVVKYLEKRKRRQFGKKVIYECRKRVADSRIRFKGRFIAKSALDT